MPDAAFGWNVFTWAWTNKAEICGYLVRVRDWFRGKPPADPERGILIIGPGGVGKTTLAAVLSGTFDWLLSEPWRYDESYGVEESTLKDDPKVNIVVPPGQTVRRETTWGEVELSLAAGKYRGVILVTANGFHSPVHRSYKSHPLYKGDKESFIAEYLAAGRQDELEVLRRLAAYLRLAPGRLWLLSVVTKEDLWWRQTDREVDQWYGAGEYAKVVSEMAADRGATGFRHEIATVSLVINTFATAGGEVLKPNLEGYDHRRQVESVRRLFELLGALLEWEVSS
jgi:hypothetical protein